MFEDIKEVLNPLKMEAALTDNELKSPSPKNSESANMSKNNSDIWFAVTKAPQTSVKQLKRV